MIAKQMMILVVAAGLVAPVLAADETTEINDLKQQVQQLDQKIRILERQKELETEAATTKASESPKVSVGDSGLKVSSADTNFVMQIRGLLQIDNRSYFDDGGISGNDGFLLRRARPIFSGTMFHDFDFLLVPDFGVSTSPQTGSPTPSIIDAYMNYRYRPWLQLRAGRMKPPVGLEQLQSDPATSFNERSIATDLAPNRDLGFQLWGDVSGGALSYGVGVFNGVGDGRSTGNADFEDHREVVARLFLQPFIQSDATILRGFGFGVGGRWGNVFSNATGLPSTTGGTLPGYATDGQQQFFAYNPTNGTVVADGHHWRVSPQAYYYLGPVGICGEYMISHQAVSKGALSADLENTAWQVSVGWVLTGEPASYAGITPRHPFSIANGHWGAVQLVGRYAELDIDDAAFPNFSNPDSSASGAQAWGVGVNWYLNKNLRVNANFSRTTFDGGGVSAATTAPATVTRQPEQVFFTRLQLSF